MLDAHLDYVSILQPEPALVSCQMPSQRGRACHYDSALLQCCALTDKTNDLVGVRILPRLTVHESPNSKVAGIADKL